MAFSTLKRKRSTKPYTRNKKGRFAKKTTKKTFKPKRLSKFSKGKKGLAGIPKRKGTGHWLSFGKGVFSHKRQGFLKSLEKVLTPQRNTYNSVFQLTAGAGLQQVYNIGSLYDGFDLFTYNRVAANDKVILKDASLTHSFTNQSNTPVFIDIYNCIARRDDVSPAAHPKGGNPTNVWTTDFGAAPTYYGATPFDSEMFVKYWKIARVTRLNLALGETAEHIVLSQPKRVWNAAVDTLRTDEDPGNTYGTLAYKGLTQYTMCVVKGAATDANNATVGSSNTVIDVITMCKYTYEQVTGVGASVNYVASTIAAVAGDIMDTGTGASAAVANA